MGLGSLPLLTVTKGDTENLLAQKLPLLSSRLIEQLKYCEALSGELRNLPAGAGNN